MPSASGHDRGARRRPVNLSLKEDLVAEVRRLSGNLSATVETLLADYVQRERARRRTEDKALDDVLAALNAFHERDGFLSDEFSSL